MDVNKTITRDEKDEELRHEILEGTAVLFNRNGLKFTMDELATMIHRSKKTIYTVFPDKETLLCSMVDHVFDNIKTTEQKVLQNPELETVEKLRKLLGAMPEQYQTVDFRKLYVLKEKYPVVYDRVQERLESGWESTIALMKKGMKEGTIRRVSIPVFKTMFESTLEQFFQRDVLVENGITYSRALDEVVNILVDGIVIRD